MVTDDTKLYELKGINFTVVRLLRSHRHTETVGELLALGESAVKSCFGMGAKRYESLIETLNRNGVDHSYSEVYESKPLCKREMYADEDISRLPGSSELIDALRKLGISNVKSFSKMTVKDMMEAGLDEALILRCTRALIKWEHESRKVGCDASIDCLHIRRSILLALKRAKINTIDDLVVLTSAELERIDGIGYSSRKEVISALQDYLESVGLLNRR